MVAYSVVGLLSGLIGKPPQPRTATRDLTGRALGLSPRALYRMLDKPIASVQEEETMTLNEWLDKHRMSQAELAKILGVSEGTVSRWRRGINEPGIDSIIKIQDITNNQVGLSDLIKRGRGVAALG
jgi:predicted XRE-type DNA-binding protein